VLLIAAGDHPGRLQFEAAWAHLCACAPIPASSGKVTRFRLDRGGDRQPSHALWRIVITRKGSHPPTRAYVARRATDGLSKREIIGCLIGGLSVPQPGQPGRGSPVALWDGLVAEPS
jgi:transposase